MMSPSTRVFLTNVGSIALALVALAYIIYPALNAPDSTPPLTYSAASTSQTASVEQPLQQSIATTSKNQALATTTIPKNATSTKVKKVAQTKDKIVTTPQSNQPSANEIKRIENPYSFAPLPFSIINDRTRNALVNILCMPHNGSLKPISGSGIIIDPRGVILTNSHVAQYILLSESPDINLTCVIRNGSPAVAHWKAEVLYMPPQWVQEHAKDILSSRPTGTGEHDYALLRITGTVDGTPMPAQFSSLPVDTREAIGFLGDQVLGAGYPAEFVGGLVAQNSLYPVSSISTIRQLLTFTSQSVDLFSLGGVIEAQSGSSGGPAVNAWGQLVGIITTTSDGATTAERDLRAITLSYISRDMQVQTGFDLLTYIGGDLALSEQNFNTQTLPSFLKTYLVILSH